MVGLQLITNSQTREKKIIFHPNFLPKIVICDPELTVGMPSSITSGTGMDAFAHCLEAYCSPHYHPMSQGMALEGMRLVKENLPIVYKDRNNITGRSHMMSAAIMGATAFKKALEPYMLPHILLVQFITHIMVQQML